MEIIFIAIVLIAGAAALAESRRQRLLEREYEDYFNRPPFKESSVV